MIDWPCDEIEVEKKPVAILKQEIIHQKTESK